MLGQVAIVGASLSGKFRRAHSGCLNQASLVGTGSKCQLVWISGFSGVVPWVIDVWTVASPTLLWDKTESGVELFGPMLFSGNTFSFSSLPVSLRWLNALLFPAGEAGWAAPPPPGRAGNFPPFIRPTALSRRAATCLQAVLDCVVSSRAYVATLPLEWVALLGVDCQGHRQVAVTDATSMILVSPRQPRHFQNSFCSSLCWFLLFGERKKKKKGEITLWQSQGQLAATVPGLL
jgi:hypothetical protein